MLNFKYYIIEQYDYEGVVWNQIAQIWRTVNDVNDVVKTTTAICHGLGITGRVTGVDYDNVCHTVKQMDWRQDEPEDSDGSGEVEETSVDNSIQCVACGAVIADRCSKCRAN